MRDHCIKFPLSILFGSTILLGTYIVTFGLPLYGGETESTAAERKSPNTARQRSRTTAVITEKVNLTSYSDTLQAMGTAVALHRADLRTDVAGVVVSTNLDTNRQVEKGDVLVQLDNSEALINLQIAEAAASQTGKQYERARKLGNSISAQDLDEVRAAYTLAESELKLARHEVSRRTLTAPISGALGLSHIQPGDYLSTGAEVVTIDNSESVLVEFELPERSVSILNASPQIVASTPSLAGKVFEGVIDSFDNRVDPDTRSVSVRARFENPHGALWPGMTFAVRISHQSTPALQLPATALTWSRDGASIWLAEDAIAKKVAVTIVHRSGDEVWVQGEFDQDALVVTEGTHKVREGAKLAFAPSDSDRAAVVAGA